MKRNNKCINTKKGIMDIISIVFIILLALTSFLLCIFILFGDDFAIISSRNDIQHYNTEKQDWCTNKFENNDNIKILTLTGSSMLPTMWEENKFICDSSIKEYKEGMIINFYDGNNNLLHRIKSVYPDFVITQGDNNNFDDGNIYLENISCVVVGVCY